MILYHQTYKLNQNPLLELKVFKINPEHNENDNNDNHKIKEKHRHKQEENPQTHPI